MKKVSLVVFAFLVSLSGIAQIIKGKVTNEEGEPLIGANVIIENTYKGTATDANGVFQFSGLHDKDYTFIVSYFVRS